MEIVPERFEDNRGSFFRAWCMEELKEIGHSTPFVQHNHSFNSKAGTIRGLHYQKPPYSEIKLVRCIKGAVWDVAVDLRKDSSTFLKSFSIKLSAAKSNALYVPDGFAHGFQTLVDDTELLYFHSENYKPGVEAGINFQDDSLQIDWPLTCTVISDRDRNLPNLNVREFQGLEI